MSSSEGAFGEPLADRVAMVAGAASGAEAAPLGLVASPDEFAPLHVTLASDGALTVSV